MPRLALFLLLSTFSLLVHAQDRKLQFCYEDHSVYPWVTGVKQGLVFYLLNKTEAELRLNFDLISLPWKRCLNEVKAGRIHAAIGASYIQDRAKWGTYPTDANGNINKELRLFYANFFVYRRNDSAVRWHNQRFENLRQQSVGVQLGYSVGKDLEELGYPITYLPASEDLVAVFKTKALEVIVLENSEADRVIAANPGLENLMVKEDDPVKGGEQYLLFNTVYYNANSALAHSIWETLAKVRRSKAYQEERAKYISSK